MWLVKFKFKSGVLVPLIFISVTCVQGQDENNLLSESDWGQITREQYAILSDNYSASYDLAKQALDWLLQNHPGLHKNVYVYGIRVYKGLINETEDDDGKKEYFKKMVSLYGQRAEYFDGNDELLSRKLTDAYLFGRQIKGAETIQLEAYNEAFEVAPEVFNSKMTLAYMDIARENFLEKNLDQDSLIYYYVRVSEILLVLNESKNPDEDLQKNQALIDRIFLDLVQLNCDDIRHRFAKSITSNQKDISYYSKLIVKLSINFKCTREDYFLPALEFVHTENPSAKVAIFLAAKYEQLKNYEKAEKYLTEAKQLSQNKDQQAEMALELARYFYRRDKKEFARNYIKESLRLVPDNADAYLLWGDLYFSSYPECQKGISRVEDRLVYLAAYEKYELAKDVDKMKEAELQFPSYSTIHMEEYSPGEELTCKCWINEKVTLRKRVEE